MQLVLKQAVSSQLSAISQSLREKRDFGELKADC